MKVTFKTLAPAGPSIHEAFDEGILLRLAGIDVMPGNVVLIGPLQDGPAGELRPIVTDDASRLSIGPDQRIQFAATLAPEMLVSATRHRFSRQQSSITARIRNLRDAPNVSATKSNDQRWFGIMAKGIGVRVPRARLRPRLRRTDSPSSRESRYSFFGFISMPLRSSSSPMRR